MTEGSAPSEGRALSERFWTGCVEPLLAVRAPGVRPAAARLGDGSDVLGLDDQRSQDHDWGLRLDLFVEPERVAAVRVALEGLPETFEGRPVRFVFSGDRRARHHVEVHDLTGVLRWRLGFDPRAGMSVADWLSLTGQAVLGITAGPVFADPAGELTAVRSALSRYPDDVRRFVVACDWLRIDEELPFVGRTGEVGDDTGSRLIAARLATVCVHLAFLLERRWPPYAKWFGTAARGLGCWSTVAPHLRAALAADAWPAREAALCAVLETLLEEQRRAGLPAPDRATAPFHDRPFRRVDPAVPGVLLEAIVDEEIAALPPGLGSAEQRTDHPLLLMDAASRRALIAVR